LRNQGGNARASATTTRSLVGASEGGAVLGPGSQRVASGLKTVIKPSGTGAPGSLQGSWAAGAALRLLAARP
jgi:hypothetical protein